MAASVLAPIPLDAESSRVLAAYEREQRLAAESAARSKATSGTDTPAQAAAATGDEDGVSGWVPRLAAVEDVPADRLAPLHGKLIAQGLLRFQLLDRTGGMVYRLSPEGRSVLAAARGEPAANVDEEAFGSPPEDAAHSEVAA